MTQPPDVGPLPLQLRPAHLGRGGSTIPQPTFTGDMAWYVGYGERHAADGVEGRLLSMHSFDAPWDSWEMHPRGSEVVIVTAGGFTLIQDDGGVQRRIELRAGEYAINPPGVWHTADVAASATAVFITCGEGTEVKPR